MIKPINRNTNTLSQKAIKTTKADAQTVTDLLDTLKAHQADCVGMAANMIGVNKRIIVFQMGVLSVALINPIITKKSSPFSTKEGCLSLLGERSTTRYKHIEVTYQDQNFITHQQQFSDWIAQIIQHEVDHCEGILI
ncbi:peptide deformylase [Pediococcus ethanolidurans]|uniref:peptide deformylase n=1 Tax=Pediococcus ethanolidurans TaxID=319653 RepID=UPI001C1EAAC2|nr:peptide deformylase [Pediococcus ethanolidurans]MBU7554093.1 peptide deformylase [Pediococcus ethanolidurans]MCT4399069.1 peptide deformylase [Pediococcus ethanolidurans]MCV3314636.1 peptide deformylase [Pediococcus ethanolidurans]MCV3321199.1 peptide deformylase [Pediococcus ethanolidurans]MCV3323973.1 peptide deformylase [Pediococcus ethanolidurans]